MTHVSDPQRGHPARRKEITEAARALAAEKGWPAVTVRAMAARIGCSAPAIYLYFRDKDAVLADLAMDGRIALALALDDSLVGIHGSAKRLRATVRGLWHFAMGNRELYAVMFGLDGLTFPGEGQTVPPMLAQAALDLAVKRGAAEAAGDLATQVFAVTHGFLSLTLAGGFPGGSEHALALLLGVVDDVVKGLGR